MEILERTYGSTTVCEYPSTLLRLALRELDEMLEEANRLLEEGEIIQSCEKFYKIIEEIVKILAEFYAQQTIQKVRQRLHGRTSPWDTRLLYEAVEEIVCGSGVFSEEEGKIFREGWRSAMSLHRDCFHDFLLPHSMMRDCVDNVRRMVEISKSKLKRIVENMMSSVTVNPAES
ncbi:hypothetical protein DRP04_08980 [Archaeoglobales archaeon]|nr:MAG: hypothetical protein DRP04_08980 [Archaeoglobales archaeon]